MGFCSKCGAEYQKGSQFCTKCGTRILADDIKGFDIFRFSVIICLSSSQQEGCPFRPGDYRLIKATINPS